jgi:hypothetical protein
LPSILGGSTSMCAMLDGRSIETMMGFAGVSGLPPRSGDVPIDVVFYLLRQRKFDDTRLGKMLYVRSRLPGLFQDQRRHAPPEGIEGCAPRMGRGFQLLRAQCPNGESPPTKS